MAIRSLASRMGAAQSRLSCPAYWIINCRVESRVELTQGKARWPQMDFQEGQIKNEGYNANSKLEKLHFSGNYLRLTWNFSANYLRQTWQICFQFLIKFFSNLKSNCRFYVSPYIFHSLSLSLFNCPCTVHLSVYITSHLKIQSEYVFYFFRTLACFLKWIN